MMTDTNICTVCDNAAETRLVLEKPEDGRGKGGVVLCQCSFCATVFQARHSESFDTELYAYYNKYVGKTKGEVYNALTRRSYSKVLDLLSSYGNVDSVLDVGCGKGDFVDFACNQGLDAKGIDLSQQAVDIGQSFGVSVFTQDFFSSGIKECSKDVVTMFELIEHVPNPGEFLKRAEAVVRPGGLVYLTTPNFHSLDQRVLGANWGAIHREHLTYFTRKTLLSTIRKNTELSAVHVETRNVSAQLLGYLTERHKPEKRRVAINTASDSSCVPSASPSWREKIYASPMLQILKDGSNRLLNATSLGSTLIVLLRRGA